ncbi:MAG: RNA polymerase sigma-I factor [Clostridia bacterium]
MNFPLRHLDKEPLTGRINRIRNGDFQEHEQLIKDYIPFIMKTISDTTNKYIESENSEEFCIGLEAFDEAIKKYDNTRGSFLAYAKQVIKSRIIDLIRKTNKYKLTIPMSQFDEKEHCKIEEQCISKDFVECLEVKEQIEQFKDKLKQYDITFSDLVKTSPKHKDTRFHVLCIIKYIASHEDLRKELIRKKQLPNIKLINDLNISIKTLNRYRKFIIAAVLILDSDLDILKSYISDLEGGAFRDL